MQIPNLNGVTLREILEKTYPDVKFHIVYHDQNGVGMILTKKCLQDAPASLPLRITNQMIAEGNYDMIKAVIEAGVKKLREYCMERDNARNNPSSRGFGKSGINTADLIVDSWHT